MNHQAAPPRAGVLYRLVLWAAFLIAVACLVYGFVSTRLWTSETWTAAGMLRFRHYSIWFFALSCAFFAFARRFYVPVVSAVALVVTMIAMGPVPVLSVLLFLVSASLLGRWLFRTESWSLALLGGLCVWAFAIGLVAQVPMHFPATYLVIHALTLTFRRTDLARLARDARSVLLPASSPKPAEFASLALFLYAFLAHWILVWKPESGGDALAMHLAIALDFARNHAFTFDFRQFIWALMPMGADYCYAAVAVIGGEFAARLLNLAMLGVVVLLLFRLARFWTSQTVSLLLAAVFVSAPLVQMLTGLMFVENFTAALAIGAVATLWNLWREPSRRSLALFALLLGSGVGWKLGGLAFVGALGPFLVVLLRKHWKQIGAPAVLASSLLFAIPAILPYAKAYALAGNPLFPLASRFKSPLLEDELIDYRYREPLSWHTPFDVTFATSRFYEGQDGSFGFQYVFLLLLAAATIWKVRSFEGRCAIAAGWLASILIFSGQPNARYLYPALPLITVGGAAALHVIRALHRRLFVACVATLVVLFGANMWFLPTSNWCHRDFYLRPLLSERGKTEYVRDIVPVREVVPYLNQTKGGVLFVQNSDIAGVRRPFFSNHWHNMPFRKRVERSRRGYDFFKVAREFGIEHYVLPKNPSPEDRADSLALYQFLDICGESELDTGRVVVLGIISNCERRLINAGPQFATRVLPPGTFDDDDGRINYLGPWFPARDFANAHAKTVTYVKDKGAEIRFEFEGSAIDYGFTKAHNRGKAEIRIDNKLVDVLDQYSPNIEWRATRRYQAQAPGRHAVSIWVMRERNDESKDFFVDFDFVTVHP